MARKKAESQPAQVVKPAQIATRIAETAKITVLAKANPKRVGSAAYDLFEAYKKAPTVGAYLQAVSKLDRRPKAGRVALSWDVARGFITVS